MSETKYKPNLQAQMQEHEMPEYKGKWKNMELWEGMSPTYGTLLYDSIKDAKAVSDAEDAKTKASQSSLVQPYGYAARPKNLYLCTIQIPVAS